MRITRFASHALTLCAGLTLVASAHARECSGYNTHVSISADVTEVAKGHTMMTFRNYDILVTDSPSDIYNMAMGECSGTMITTPDGKTGGLGHCVRKDKNGDSASIEWAIEPGAEKGTWKSTGGTGKFADLKSEGWWMPVTTDGGKLGVNRWGGTCSK